MPDMIEIKIEGMEKIQRQLKELTPRCEQRIVKHSLRAAAKPILELAKAYCPISTIGKGVIHHLPGTLRNSIKIRSMKKRKNSFGVVIGTALKWFIGDTFYGAFVEFGHSKLSRKSQKRRKAEGLPDGGHVAARPFMRPAFDEGKSMAIHILETELKDELNKIDKA